jgi:hypothetical protein
MTIAEELPVFRKSRRKKDKDKRRAWRETPFQADHEKRRGTRPSRDMACKVRLAVYMILLPVLNMDVVMRALAINCKPDMLIRSSAMV